MNKVCVGVPSNVPSWCGGVSHLHSYIRKEEHFPIVVLCSLHAALSHTLLACAFAEGVEMLYKVGFGLYKKKKKEPA